MAARTTDRYAMTLAFHYPEFSSRGLARLGLLFPLMGLMLIPYMILIYFLQIAFGIVAYIGYWAVLFTGRYPRGLFKFAVGVQVGIQRWLLRTTGWAVGWTDRRPPSA